MLAYIIFYADICISNKGKEYKPVAKPNHLQFNFR